MHIESNGEMGRFLQGSGFQDQALLPPLLISHEVILEKGLDFLIIPISIPLFPLQHMRGVVNLPSEVSSAFSILGTFITLLPLEFHLLHFYRQ
jgi:hypothetical protein